MHFVLNSTGQGLRVEDASVTHAQYDFLVQRDNSTRAEAMRMPCTVPLTLS